MINQNQIDKEKYNYNNNLLPNNIIICFQIINIKKINILIIHNNNNNHNNKIMHIFNNNIIMQINNNNYIMMYINNKIITNNHIINNMIIIKIYNLLVKIMIMNKYTKIN